MSDFTINIEDELIITPTDLFEENKDSIETWEKGGDYYEKKIQYFNNDDYVITFKKNGKYHKDAGPAIFEYINDGFELYSCWYKDGKLHRLEGPSVISRNYINDFHAMDYYINGVIYENYKDFEKKKKEMRKELTEELTNIGILYKDLCNLVSEYVI